MKKEKQLISYFSYPFISLPSTSIKIIILAREALRIV